jgi:hypothetical protein
MITNPLMINVNKFGVGVNQQLVYQIKRPWAIFDCNTAELSPSGGDAEVSNEAERVQ